MDMSSESHGGGQSEGVMESWQGLWIEGAGACRRLSPPWAHPNLFLIAHMALSLLD